MRDGIATVIRFVTSFAGSGAEMAEKSIEGVRKAALIGTKGLATLGAAIGQAGGKFGRMAREAANMMWSIQQLGALGGVMAGAQIAIDRISEHFIAKADAMAEAAERMKDRINDRLDRLNAARLNEVDKALKEATTDADKAAAAFNAMATAYMKVANAGNGKMSAFESSEIADMELRKANEMANASPDDAPIVGAKADISIAEKRLGQTVEDTERRIGLAGREEADARHRLAMAKDKEKAASAALAKASEELQASEDSDNRDIETLRQRKAKAEETYAAAVNARVLAEADAKAATENELKVRYESAQAISSAKRSVVEAKMTHASLERAKAEKDAAEKERKEKEKKEKAEKAVEEQRKEEARELRKRIKEESQRRDSLNRALEDATARANAAHDVLGNAANMDQAGGVSENRREFMNNSRFANGAADLIGSGKIRRGANGEWVANGRLSNMNQAILERLNADQNKQKLEKENDKVVKKLDELLKELKNISEI